MRFSPLFFLLLAAVSTPCRTERAKKGVEELQKRLDAMRLLEADNRER